MFFGAFCWEKKGSPSPWDMRFGFGSTSFPQEEEQENAFTRDDEPAVSSSSNISDFDVDMILVQTAKRCLLNSPRIRMIVMLVSGKSMEIPQCQAGEPLACTSPIGCAQRRGRGGKWNGGSLDLNLDVQQKTLFSWESTVNQLWINSDLSWRCSFQMFRKGQ